MSINNETGTLPDVTLLEKLANELFNASPGQETGVTTVLPQSVQDTGTEPVASTGFNNSVPAGGLGISPSVAHNANTINLRDAGIAGNNNSNNGGRIPVSVAGSGASPSTIQHGNNINIDNPQTSFPDENLKNNHAGSDKGDGLNGLLPFEADSDLSSILAGIRFYTPGSQLPDNGSAFSYYFLGQQDFSPENSNSGFADKTALFQKKESISGATFPWGFDANIIKKDFPILSERVNGKPLIWLDNAATTQKPKAVIDRLGFFYEHENSNIHRAAHELAARATDAYEGARKTVQTFINAGSANEVVFVRGTTEAINLVAKSYGEQFLRPGDEVIVSHLEHHANIVPWQQLAQKNGIKLRVIPVDDNGQVLLDEYARLLNNRTKIVSFTQVSNALGTITPAKTIIDMAHAAGARVLLDGAQSVSHLRADVQALDVDWFVFSGHKIFGPTGIGVLYGKEDLLNLTAPWQGGGNMIKDVTFEYTQYHNAPSRFEAGTGNIADAVGLGAALDYVTKLGIDNIYQYEHYLLLYAIGLMKEVPGLRLIGTAAEKTSVLSFVLDGYSNDEVGQALNNEGIAVRTGHHCAQPILRRFGLESTVRPSLALYNTCADVDALVATLYNLKRTKK